MLLAIKDVDPGLNSKVACFAESTSVCMADITSREIIYINIEMVNNTLLNII